MIKSKEETAKDLAYETANTAVTLAATASKTAADLATETAKTTTRIDTNMVWMMKSLESIELKLSEMARVFITSSQHQEVLTVQADHEQRIRKLEKDLYKWLGAVAVITFIISMLMPSILKLIPKL